MKKLLIILALLLPPAEGIVLAQRGRRPPPPQPPRYEHYREIRHQEKRDELSKKLMERKNELRREDRVRDQRAHEAKPRSK